MLLRIKRLDPTVTLPEPATRGAAGFDLAAASDVEKTKALLSPVEATLPAWLVTSPGEDKLDLASTPIRSMRMAAR